jgi:hypothetical protein
MGVISGLIDASLRATYATAIAGGFVVAASVGPPTSPVNAELNTSLRSVGVAYGVHATTATAPDR